MSSKKKKMPKAKGKIVSILKEDESKNEHIVLPDDSIAQSTPSNVLDDNRNSPIEPELSDDLFDALECDVHELSTEQSLEEKMKKHKQLKETTVQLIAEVDRLIALMHRTNKPSDLKEMTMMAGKLDEVSEEGGDHITHNMITNIMGEVEYEAGNLASIEQLNDQIRRYQLIMKKIAICKEYYGKGQINVKNLN